MNTPIDSAVSLCGLDVDGLSASFERDLERVLEVMDGAFVEPGGVSGGLNTSSSSAASDCCVFSASVLGVVSGGSSAVVMCFTGICFSQ